MNAIEARVFGRNVDTRERIDIFVDITQHELDRLLTKFGVDRFPTVYGDIAVMGSAHMAWPRAWSYESSDPRQPYFYGFTPNYAGFLPWFVEFCKTHFAGSEFTLYDKDGSPYTEYDLIKPLEAKA
jgi:hypothetical protein